MKACLPEIKAAAPAQEAQHGVAAPESQSGGTNFPGQTPRPNVTASAPAQTSPAATHPENWAQVEGVYLQEWTMIGAGGMPLPTYEPVVFFQDGSYYEVDEAALEDVDLTQERNNRPKAWGRWQKQGSAIVLTRSNGHQERTELQERVLFQAFAAEAANRQLRAKYKRVSGGGNTALGGSAMVAVTRELAFSGDGHFQGGSSAYVNNTGSGDGASVAGGSSKQMATPGEYRIEKHTLTLRYPDGRTERRFFAFGSAHTPAELDTAMIFIGRNAYVVD